MKKHLLCIAIAMCFLALAIAAPAQSGPIVRHAIKHDVSRTLTEMVASTPLPVGNPHVEIEAPRPTRPLPVGPGAKTGRDTALQTSTLPLINTVPGLNFDGVGANGYAPPDTNVLGGTHPIFSDHERRVRNLRQDQREYSAWPRADSQFVGWISAETATLMMAATRWCFGTRPAQRWVVSQLSGTYTNWCMAVSTSADATGTYYRYAFSSGGNLDDYPKVGIWPDASYYRATNSFQNGQNFASARMLARWTAH